MNVYRRASAFLTSGTLVLAGLTGLTGLVGLTGIAVSAPASAEQAAVSSIVVGSGTTQALTNPLAIDVAAPRFDWTVSSPAVGASVAAAQLEVRDSAGALVWSKEESGLGIASMTYAGPALAAKSRYEWRVRVQDQTGAWSTWSDDFLLGTGMMNESDWDGASWIAQSDWQAAGGATTTYALNPVVVTFPETTARILSLNVTGLGLSASDEASSFRLQLAEVQARNGSSGTNVAAGASVTASNAGTGTGWDPSFLVDGTNDSGTSTKRGYTSTAFPSADISTTPITLDIDLGSAKTVDRVVLYPRTDVGSAVGGRSANFPTAFTVSTREIGTPAATTQVLAETDVANPAYSTTGNPYTVSLPQPVTAKSMTLNVTRVSDVYGDGSATGPQYFYLQLAEIQAFQGAGANLGTNYAQGSSISVNNVISGTAWAGANAVDGVTNTNTSTKRGWSTNAFTPTSPTPATPVTATIDFGTTRTFQTLRFWPRTDKSVTINGAAQTPSFLRDYTLSVTTAPQSGPATQIATYSNSTAPARGGTVTLGLPLLRTGFTVPEKEIAHATLFVSGLGTYVASVNGERAGDLELGSGWTKFDKRTFYDGIDVTASVKAGQNVLGIALGQGHLNGFHTMSTAARRGTYDGLLRAKADLVVTYVDGTTQSVPTGTNWKAATGPSLPFSLNVVPEYEGYDARKAIPGWDTASFDATAWGAVVPANNGTAVLQSNRAEPARYTEQIPLSNPTNPASGVYVYNVGKNINGNARVSIPALPSGTSVRIRYAEKISGGRGVLFQTRYQDDTYISDGTAATWTPPFTRKGFQYIDISGLGDAPAPQVTALLMHNDMATDGTFESSSPVLNFVHEAGRATVLNNLATATPTDGSYIEKLPWLGDGAVMTNAILRNFDAEAVFTKWFNDIADSQMANGDLPAWAPSPTAAADLPDAGWGNAFTEVALHLMDYYSNDEAIEARYPQMKSYATLIASSANNPTMRWGDWVCPDGVSVCNTAAAKTLVGRAYAYRTLTQFAEIATRLGHPDDAATFTDAAAAARSSFNTSYYQAASGTYRTSGAGFFQAHNVLPVAFGITPLADRQRVMDAVAADVVARGNHLGTGILGTKWLFPMLTKYGYTDLAYTAATIPTAPGYGYMYSTGATTLVEDWTTNPRSLGHPFLGTAEDWMLADIAGLVDTGATSDTVVVKPHLPTGLDRAATSYDTNGGTSGSSWKRDGGKVELVVDVPVSRTGSISVPVPAGQHVIAPPGATKTSELSGGYEQFSVPSGHHVFRTTDVAPPSGVLTTTVTSPSQSAVIPVTLTFDQAVSGLEAAELDVDNGVVSNFSGTADTYTFTVTAIVSGPVTISVPAGAVQSAQGQSSVAVPALTVTVDLTPQVPTTISGTVTDSAGNPLGSVCVYLYTSRSAPSASHASCTDPDGIYYIVATAGTFEVAVSDPAYAHATTWRSSPLVASGDVNGVDLAMDDLKDARIVGTITATQPAGPAGNVCVFAYQEDRSDSASYASCSAADGSYTVWPMQAGTYDVAFFDPVARYTTQWASGSTGGAASQAGAVAVALPTGASSATVDARMSGVSNGSASGRVTNAAGNPVADVCVYLYTSAVGPAAYGTCTQADGTWYLGNVSPGTYRVAFADPAGGLRTQWWTGTPGGATSYQSASDLGPVTAGGALTGLDAAMAALPPAGSS